MNKLKRYLKNHPEATVKDYENQRHEQHIIQARMGTIGKHDGSKRKKTLLHNIHYVQNKIDNFMKA